jgi:hypothetical protein
VLSLSVSLDEHERVSLHYNTKVFINATVWKCYNVDRTMTSGCFALKRNFSGTYSNILLVDLQFEEAVYPFRVNVYETYNPGSVVRIWAGVKHQEQVWLWRLLWEGEPQRVGHTPRVFSPVIQTISVPTE